MSGERSAKHIQVSVGENFVILRGDRIEVSPDGKQVTSYTNVGIEIKAVSGEPAAQGTHISKAAGASPGNDSDDGRTEFLKLEWRDDDDDTKNVVTLLVDNKTRFNLKAEPIGTGIKGRELLQAYCERGALVNDTSDESGELHAAWKSFDPQSGKLTFLGHFKAGQYQDTEDGDAAMQNFDPQTGDRIRLAHYQSGQCQDTSFCEPAMQNFDTQTGRITRAGQNADGTPNSVLSGPEQLSFRPAKSAAGSPQPGAAFNAASHGEAQAQQILSLYDFGDGLGSLVADAMSDRKGHFYVDHVYKKTDLNQTENFKSYRQAVMTRFPDLQDIEYRSRHNGVYFWLKQPNIMDKVKQELVYRIGCACSPNAY